MSSVNKAILVGNMGKDSEVVMISDKEVCKFSMATSVKWKDNEKTTWHNVVVWNEATTRYLKQYARKGSKVYVEGSIDNRSYEKDGVTKYISEVVVGAYDGNVKILSSNRENGADDGGGDYAAASGKAAAKKAAPADAHPVDLNDEVPF